MVAYYCSFDKWYINNNDEVLVGVFQNDGINPGGRRGKSHVCKPKVTNIEVRLCSKRKLEIFYYNEYTNTIFCIYYSNKLIHINVKVYKTVRISGNAIPYKYLCGNMVEFKSYMAWVNSFMADHNVREA